MGIMDNEGHDPLGFGNILSHTDGNDLRRLKAENAQLQARLDLQMPAIEELTKEREMYRMRWLGSMSIEDAALIRAENERSRRALESTVNWLRRNASAEQEPKARKALIEAHNAIRSIAAEALTHEQIAGEKNER